jgi:hypothetical protein
MRIPHTRNLLCRIRNIHCGHFAHCGCKYHLDTPARHARVMKMLPICAYLFQIGLNVPSYTLPALLELQKGVAIIGTLLNYFKSR